MIDTSIIPGIIRILLVCVIITAACIISTRNLLSLVSMYSLQSATLAGLALALYALEPAAARYRIDYQLTISTTGQECTLITPFSLPLKQVLVDHLGNRVSERIDDYAPLL